MKTIKELTNEELLKLTEKEIQDIVDYECALEGIKLLPEKPQEPIEVKIKKDATVYKIPEVTFSDFEEAKRVIKVITECEGLVKIQSKNWEEYYVDKINEDDYNYPKITNFNCYSKECFEKISEKLDAYKAAKSDYIDKFKEYSEIRDEINEIRDELINKIDKAKKRQESVEFYKKRFDRYMELADNDGDIAKKFLLEAYPDAENYAEIRYLWGEI